MQNFFLCGFSVPQLGQSILGAEPTPRGSAVNENQSPRKEIVAYIDSYHRRPNSGLRYRTPAEVRPPQLQPAGQPPVGTDFWGIAAFGCFVTPWKTQGWTKADSNPGSTPHFFPQPGDRGLAGCESQNESPDCEWKPQECVRRASNPCDRWCDSWFRLTRQRTSARLPLTRSCSCDRLQARSRNHYLQGFCFQTLGHDWAASSLSSA